jgi:hypothetical protein
MKKPDIDKLQETNHRALYLCHRRLCPACREQIPTVRGKFVTHGPAANGDFTCPNSGQLVNLPEPEAQKANEVPD